MARGDAPRLPRRRRGRRQDVRDARTRAAGAREYGEDVVVGFVETHGRAKTAAQVGDLEVVPRQQIEYRGTTFEEMDIDAVLAPPPRGRAGRRARAHERARLEEREALAGRRGAPRGRDRRHLDAEHPAPRVPERRRRADHLRQAARDDPRRGRSPRRPDPARRHHACRRCGDRLAHGNVYPAERIDAALANYFRPGNLTALRELALSLARRPRRRGPRRVSRAARDRASRGRRESACSSP